MSSLTALRCMDSPRQCLEPCGCLPAGFSRLKYFYGKHLNVADFKDEQRYHAGKHLFHNQRLHGAGVLCGLDVCVDDRYPRELRVRRGTALDHCGREIIVPHDQCIDVAAWYRAWYENYLEQNPDSEWPQAILREHGSMAVCVMLRYAECPTGPEAAPRDPCGCGDNVCEFGRISEGFQIELMPHAEAVALLESSMFPAEEQIADVLDSTFRGQDLIRRLAGPITHSCPGGIEEAWIMLGCVEITPDQDDPADIAGVSASTGYVPPVLLSTEVIQYLLALIYSEIDAVSGGPSIMDVRWRMVTDVQYQMILVLDGEIDENSIDPDDSFRLRKMTENGWDEPAAKAVTSEYSTTDPNAGQVKPDEVVNEDYAIYVTINDSNYEFLEAGYKYQLYMGETPGPVVDSDLRGLRPRNFIRRFMLTQHDSGDLEMQSPPFGP